MIDRRHPRDLYDLFRFVKSGLAHVTQVALSLVLLAAAGLFKYD